MVAAARNFAPWVRPIDEVERAFAVLPPGETLSPWTDHVVTGFHGRIAVRETRGTGLPLVLLHGNSACKEVFDRQMAGALGARHRMIAIDLPGHGASDNARDPHRSYTLTGYADAVLDTIERLGVERFALLGWSLGGHVALEIAAGAPGVAGAMIVGAPPIGTSFEAISAAFRPSPLVALAFKPELSEAEIEVFAQLAGLAAYPSLVAALRRADGHARGRVIEDVVRGGAADEREIVANLGVPLAIVNGANDPLVAPGYLEGLSYASLWEGRCHTFPHAGHAPFLDLPELFNATLARFLYDLEQRAAVAVATPGLCLGG